VKTENEKAKVERQQVIERLGERWIQGDRESLPECKLGREPPRRRSGACSACTIKPEFEIDVEVTRLINKKAFSEPSARPYRIASNQLLSQVTLGLEALRARDNKTEKLDVIHALQHALMSSVSVEERTDASRRRYV
jgi:hypothetical protein